MARSTWAQALFLALSGWATNALAQPLPVLPDLGEPPAKRAQLSLGGTGLLFSNQFDGSRVRLGVDFNARSGAVLSGSLATGIGSRNATGLVFSAGNRSQELLLNSAWQVSSDQRLLLTTGVLRQGLDIDFVSGRERVSLLQSNFSGSYRWHLGQTWLNAVEALAYVSRTPSRKLSDLSYSTDSATLFELWTDPRRVVGGRVTGWQGRALLNPFAGTDLRLGAGGEQLTYDHATGPLSTSRAVASAEWTQHLSGGLKLRVGLDSGVASDRYSLGLEQAVSGGRLGVDLTALRGRQGLGNDQALKLYWSRSLGIEAERGTSTGRLAGGSSKPAWGSLLDDVSRRPSHLPSQVVAKLDNTAPALRTVAINKAALPAGSVLDKTSGAVRVSLGLAVTGLAGVTLNGAAFANAGQFTLQGNELSIQPLQMTPPAAGAQDTYVVTANNLAGGTTLITVLVSKGSVQIDSIVVSPGAPMTTVLSGFADISKLLGDPAFNLTPPTSNRAGAFNYISSNLAVARVSGSTVTLVGAGSTVITAQQAAGGGFAAASISATLNVGGGTPALGALAALNKTFGDAPFLLVAPSSNSSGAFSYSSSNPAVATVSGSTITLVGVGSTTLTATQAAAGNFTGGATTTTLTVAPGLPTLGAWPGLNKAFGDPAFTLSPPASNSSGAFTFSSNNPAVATVSGNTVTLVGAGTAALVAAQAAAGNYSARVALTTLNVNGTTPTLGAWANLNKTFGDAPFLLVAPSSTSPGAFSYTSSNPAVAVVSGASVTIVGAGSTTITATQANAGSYYSTSTSATLTVAAVAPTLGAWAAINKTFGDAAFALSPPSSNSAGAFSYSSSNPAVATVSGNTVTLVGVGIANIVATQQAALGYTGGTAIASLTVAPATPLLGTWPALGKTFGDPAFVLAAPASNSAGSFSFSSSNPAVATVSGNTVTVVGAGSTTLTANQAASGNYAVASSTAVLTVAPASPTLGSWPALNKTFGDAAFVLSPPASNSAGAFSYSSSNTAVASISGNTVTLVGAGNVTLTATQAAAGSYSTSSTSTSLNVASATTTLGSFAAVNKNFGDAPFVLTAPSSNSPGAFSYSSSNTAVATVSGSTVTIVGAGSTQIVANQAAAGSYLAGSTQATLTVAPVAPTWGAVVAISKTFGNAPFVVAAPSSNSAGAFSFSSSNTAVATVSGNTVTLVGAGSANIVVTQAASGGYTLASGNAALTVALGAPTLGSWAASNKTFGDAAFALSPPASNSAGAFSYSSNNQAVATVSGSTVTIVGAGSSTLTATQAAAGPYASASTTAVLTVAAQAPTLGAWSAISKAFGDPAFALSPPTSNSAGAFSYSGSDPSVASVSGNTVTVMGAGTATLTATQIAAGNYSAGSVTATISVSGTAPTLGSFSAINKTFGDAPFGLAAPSSNSPGTFSFSSSNPAVASVSGSTVTIVGAGTSTITAQQGNTASFFAASTSATLTVTAIAPTLGSLAAIAKTFGDAPFALTAPSSNSAGAFSYSSSNTAVATVSGSIVTLVGPGTANIVATQAAAGGYSTGTASAALTVAPGAPTLGSWAAINKTFGDGSFNLSAPSSNSAGTFSYSSSNTAVATASGSTVTIVGAGSTTLTATQAAAGNFSSVSATATLTVQGAAPTLSSFNAITATYGTLPFAVFPPNTNSAGALSYSSSNTAVATVSGNMLTIVGAGVSTITANQAANGNFAAGAITTTLTVSGTAPTIGGFTAMMVTYGSPFTLTAPQSNSAGSFSYTSSDPSVATISGNTVTTTGVGPTMITATQAASGGFNAGSVTATLMVNPLQPSYGSFTLPNKSFGDGNFTISPPASTSAAAFTYLSSDPSVATISGSTITITGAGSATITAFQGAGGVYAPGSTTGTLTVGVATPVLSGFGNFSRAVGDPNGLVPAPTSPSSGAFSYTSSNPAVAAISGVNLIVVGVGSTTITATQAANGNYASASATATLTVVPGTPVLSGFVPINKTFGDAAFNLTPPTSPSAGSISYSSSNTAVATVSGLTVTVVGAGTCTITATQAASGDYLQGSASATLTVAGAAPTLGTFTNVSKTYGNAAFVLTPPSSNSAGAFTYSSSNTAVATVSGSTVTITGAGTSTITATQAATGNYAGGSTSMALTVAPGAPTITGFNGISKTYGDGSFTLTAPSSNSAGSLSYASSNTAVATVSGSTVTIVAAGTVTLTATQAAAGNYGLGTATATLFVDKATPSIAPIADVNMTSADFGQVCIGITTDSCYESWWLSLEYAVDFGPALNGTTNTADLGRRYGGWSRNALRDADTVSTSGGLVWMSGSPVISGPSAFFWGGFNIELNSGSQTTIVTITRAETANFKSASTSFSITVHTASVNGSGQMCLNGGVWHWGSGQLTCLCPSSWSGDFCERPGPQSSSSPSAQPASARARDSTRTRRLLEGPAKPGATATPAASAARR